MQQRTSQKSEWFKKDCSAALLVPRLTVASLPSISALTGSALAIGLNDDDPHTPSHKHSSLILRMSNPQSTPVRVRLAHDPALLSAVAAAAPLPSNEISDPTIDGAADGPGYVIHHEECIPSGVIVAAGYGESMYMGSSSVGLGDYTGMCDMGRHKASPRSSGPGEVQEEGAADTAATAAVVGPTNVTTISVTVSPKSPTLVGDGGWAMLDGKEDELFLRASSAVIGSRYRLPESAIRLAAETPTSTGAGAAPAAKQRSTGENVDGAGDDESGRDSAGATQGTPPFVLHQQGDVVWVQLPFDEVAAEGVAAAAGAASKDGVNDDSEDPGSGGEVGAVISVTVRFLLVMSDWEDAGRGGEVRMPVAVRFPLSACPR